MPRKAALLAFGLCSVAQLVSLAVGVTWLEWATKAALMPTLAAWVWLRGGPRLVVAALLLSACGDVALQFDAGQGIFILGMGFFAAAHGCYISFFLRGGAGAVLRRRWFIIGGYAIVWVTLIAILWSGLGALRLPVAGYSLLLAGTAATSAAYGLRAGLGGALFLVSDSLIALGLADLPEPPRVGLWVMSTYIVAQYLLASGSGTASARVAAA